MKHLLPFAALLAATALLGGCGNAKRQAAERARQDSIRQDSIRHAELLANPATRDSVIDAELFKGKYRAVDFEMGDMSIDPATASIQTKANSGKAFTTRADICGWVHQDGAFAYGDSTMTFTIMSDYHNGLTQEVSVTYNDRDGYVLHLVGEQHMKEDNLHNALPRDIKLQRIG